VHFLILAMSLGVASPCDLPSSAEVEAVLAGAAVPVPADQIGEETAPVCLWATAGRASEVKLTIWSDNELPVVSMPDAAAYFLKLHADAATGGRVMPLAGLGERAFAADLNPKASGKADGSIVVLKGGRVIVFDFTDVISRDAQVFAGLVAERL
jgi:hypothetical protein